MAHGLKKRKRTKPTWRAYPPVTAYVRMVRHELGGGRTPTHIHPNSIQTREKRDMLALGVSEGPSSFEKQRGLLAPIDGRPGSACLTRRG